MLKSSCFTENLRFSNLPYRYKKEMNKLNNVPEDDTASEEKEEKIGSNLPAYRIENDGCNSTTLSRVVNILQFSKVGGKEFLFSNFL